VSNSSDDENESEKEDVSETSEGVVERGILLRPEVAGCVGACLCDEVACSWDATLRGRGSLFLRPEKSAFDPRMTGVPVVGRCEGGPYCTVAGDGMTQSIDVSSVAVILATRESGVCGMTLSKAGAKTGRLVAEGDDGSMLGKAVVLV
jgi:hypothetical protein